MKLNSSGIPQWSRQHEAAAGFGTRGNMALDSAGNVFLCGWTAGVLDDNIQYGGSDVFIIKFSSSGVWAWTPQRGSSGDDFAF
eukprot:39300-Karenia_brevis.AAC.1